jgi:nitrous oxidase accessory protein
MHLVEAITNCRPTGPRNRRITLRFGVLVAILYLVLAVPMPNASAQGETIIVCPDCEFDRLEVALDAVEPGGRIEVRGGVYRTSMVIDKPVELIGIDDPVIDGGGEGTVIFISADDVTIEGFVVRSSGSDLHRENAGISIEGKSATISNSRVEDVLFGIYLKFADDARIIDNVVVSKPLDIARRGDGIRTWYSHRVVIEGNIVRDGRDVILWYSEGGVVRDNAFDRGRYGLHLMFSDNTLVQGNSFRGNSVGFYAMYSRDVHIVSNLMADNYGASGIGLGLKDVDDALIESNRIVNNRVGVHNDNSPREIASEVHFFHNAIAFNGIGIGFFPAVRRNTLSENTFEDNIQHVAIIGGGELRDITWTVERRGNYWSDYVGYDADRDGIGDVPYRSERLFESITDEHPKLRLFLFSPAALGIDFAAKAFPAVRPQPKLVDTGPLVQPTYSDELPPVPGPSLRDRLLTASIGLVGITAFVAGLGRLRRRGLQVDGVDTADRLDNSTPERSNGAALDSADSLTGAEITVRNLSKSYGRSQALHGVTFEIEPGESVALWGPNGAGKTTILRCLLGIADCSGDVSVLGGDPRNDGRTIRKHIGFVPQEFPVVPMTVAELVGFIAELKQVPFDHAFAQLELLEIDDQADKAMSALSGGMKQRVALALALIGDPSILFLDEPTANLDARGRAELIELLRRLREAGKTILFCSHRPDDVLALADRVLLIEQGHLQDAQTRDQFRKNLWTESHLILRIGSNQAEQALSILKSSGARTTGNGAVLVVPVSEQTKASIIQTLIQSGITIEDFDLEYGYGYSNR